MWCNLVKVTQLLESRAGGPIAHPALAECPVTHKGTATLQLLPPSNEEDESLLPTWSLGIPHHHLDTSPWRVCSPTHPSSPTPWPWPFFRVSGKKPQEGKADPGDVHQELWVITVRPALMVCLPRL